MAKKRKFGLDSSDFDIKEDIEKERKEEEEDKQEETAARAALRPEPVRKPAGRKTTSAEPSKYKMIGAKTCVIFRGNNLETLKREARVRGYSMGEFLNMIVEEYFSHPENKTFRD